MRSLPAALLALVAVVPALTVMTTAPAAGAASRTVAELATAQQVATAHPVATSVDQLALTSLRAQTSGATANVPAGLWLRRKTGGGPGVLVRPTTGAPAVLARASNGVLTQPTSTKAFQTLGLTWAPSSTEPDLLISVRTHRTGCPDCSPVTPAGWSPWSDLSDDTEDADDATATAALRGGTSPLWAGPSDGVQVRIVVRSGKMPDDVKLALVNPGASAYDQAAASTPPGSSASAGISAAGIAATPAAPGGLAEPLILSRASWGADESKVRSTPTYMPTIKATVLHHTAGPNNYSAHQVPSIIRGDYAYHLSRGWSDIGYNALVDRFGRIWEGRAGGLSQAVMGAHAGGFNTDTFGVSMIGNYDVARPTAAAIAAVTRVMAWKLDLNHRNPLGSTRLTSMGGGTARYRAGTTVTLPVIMGHRNTGFTACPGRYLYPFLPSIRTRVAALMRAALTNPARPPASVPRGSPVSITARALAAQAWQLDVVAACTGSRVARITGRARAQAQIIASWNGRQADRSLARPGRYLLTLTSHSSRGIARPVSAAVLVLPPVPVAVPPAQPFFGPAGYRPVTPSRLLDTRAAGNTGLGPVGRVDVPVLGRAGIPLTGVTAVVLNLTADCASDDTALAVWPSGAGPSGRPVTAIPSGQTRSVLVTSRVGANGSVSIGNARGVTELTADVVGYYQPGGSPIQPISSTPLYDSRTDTRTGLAGPLSAHRPRLIPLPATLGGIPAARITALVVDISALTPTGPGTVSAYRPDAAGNLATLSYRAGHSTDNLAIVEVSGGAIALKTTGASVNVSAEVRAVVVDGTPGSYAGAGTFTAIKPRLVFDTTTAGAELAAGRPQQVVITGLPAGASAVLISLTGVAPALETSLQVYPWGQPAPIGSAVRVPAGDTRGNLVVVPLGTDAALAVSNARGLTGMRVDVQGYFQ